MLAVLEDGAGRFVELVENAEIGPIPPRGGSSNSSRSSWRTTAHPSTSPTCRSCSNMDHYPTPASRCGAPCGRWPSAANDHVRRLLRDALGPERRRPTWRPRSSSTLRVSASANNCSTRWPTTRSRPRTTAPPGTATCWPRSWRGTSTARDLTRRRRRLSAPRCIHHDRRAQSSRRLGAWLACPCRAARRGARHRCPCTTLTTWRGSAMMSRSPSPRKTGRRSPPARRATSPGGGFPARRWTAARPVARPSL